ncbi:MAG: alanine--tRNA ligase [Lentisphaeria bacterium]|nr:alanine--tRNA ligase [Lentisphaeria bacterium]
MKADELRQKFLDFFQTKGHSVISSAPLIPENDPTVLFTTAGMHPLVPYLMGEKHPAGTKLCNFQKCIRTGDIEEVGDDTHLTFFEMLGNWSLGEYFKREAIEYSFEFLTAPQWLNLPLERLAFTVFAGDEDAPFDDESFAIWRELGVSEDRIAQLPKKDNWWGPAGVTGPCGPDTEMFYWVGEEAAPAKFDPEDKRWVEIWNDVFMQYNKNEAGNFEPLTQRNVDTGMGLERVSAVLQGKSSCYDTELFIPLFDKLEEITGFEKPRNERAGRIVVEHIRSAVFIMADGVYPGNVGQAYVLRRLIRRAARECRKLNYFGLFAEELAKLIIDNYKHVYSELDRESAKILEELRLEEEQFRTTLENGEKQLRKLIDRVPDFVEKKVISGKNAFDLFQTYGYPLEITIEMAAESGFDVDVEGYEKALAKHQEKSRANAGNFKGGLQDHSEQTTRLHTATHLLQQALKDVVGDHISQKGSNITGDRLRFDFNNPEKVTKEQLIEVEKIVNDQIQRGLEISFAEMTVEDAKEAGAIGVFSDRYGELVKVYSIGDYSKEICGGPHAANTKELGRFKILKEESSSRGVRRIKANVFPQEA